MTTNRAINSGNRPEAVSGPVRWKQSFAGDWVARRTGCKGDHFDGDQTHFRRSSPVRVFIVHAHHEPSSFNGALTGKATETLLQANHEVVVSDLYEIGFDPVSDRRNFVTVSDASRLRQQAEENYASTHDGFSPEIQAEMDKLDWCDVMIFQFPLWWLGLPAILKGWVDRVFAVGRVYGGGRYFNRGVFVGKRAMCSVTVGGPADAYSDEGAYGPIEKILYPIQHGILAFVGFAVIEPFVIYAPSRADARQRRDLLRRYGDRMLELDKAPTIPLLNVEQFDGLVRRERSGNGRLAERPLM